MLNPMPAANKSFLYINPPIINITKCKIKVATLEFPINIVVMDIITHNNNIYNNILDFGFLHSFLLHKFIVFINITHCKKEFIISAKVIDICIYLDFFIDSGISSTPIVAKEAVPALIVNVVNNANIENNVFFILKFLPFIFIK